MVVLGNPPYSVSSSNKGEWIEKLMVDYKKDLNEQNIQPLSDDYLKFIRYGQHFIEKNGEGVLAYISNNSFIEGVIHRQMRKHLLETFDKIYILDLHGNAKKKETAPDGSKDENVFDIRQGVSINIFAKTRQKKKGQLADVYKLDTYGTRKHKYQALWDNDLSSIAWEKLVCKAPKYFFVKKNFEVEAEYERGILISELFPFFSSGISTHRDHFVVDFEKTDLTRRIQEFYNTQRTDDEIRAKLRIKDSGTWKISNERGKAHFQPEKVNIIIYRPFDYRYIYYDCNLIDRGREKVMTHLLTGENFAFSCLRQSRASEAGTFLISKEIVSKDTVSLLDRCSVFPLYLYSESNAQQTLDGRQERMPNLSMEIVNQIYEKIELVFTTEKEEREGTFAPIDILDYIYAVLHSPAYREKYKEFL